MERPRGAESLTRKRPRGESPEAGACRSELIGGVCQDVSKTGGECQDLIGGVCQDLIGGVCQDLIGVCVMSSTGSSHVQAHAQRTSFKGALHQSQTRNAQRSRTSEPQAPLLATSV